MPLISVQQVSKSYHSRKLLDQISFSINEGDRIALIGSNGAGKTTLFRMIEGKTAPDEGCIIHHGRVITGFLSQNLDEQMNGDNPLKTPELIALEKEIRFLEEMLANATDESQRELLDKYAQAAAKYDALGGYDYEHRLREVLSGLGLSPDDLTRPIESLSGGERMRISLAKLIVMHPDVLLLDEPTNHLDTEAMEWLEEYIRKYSGAVLLISHDRYFIDHTASLIIELENGDIKTYRGNYSAYVRQKEQFIADQRQFVAGLEKEIERQAGVTQTMLSHRKMSSYHARERVVAKLSDKLREERAKLSGSPMKMSFSFIPEKREGDPDKILLRTQNLSKTFLDSKPLFTGVSIQIHASDKIVLAGPNGCGKTTLLSILLGRIPDFDGDVLISAEAQCGYMGQFIPFSDENREIIDEVFSRTELTETQARNLLARFGFRDIDVFKKIQVLSGGERSRLYLCCLLQESPDILFLDEPTNHLDIQSREILEQALADYTGAVLAVSHDRYFIEKCSRSLLGFIGNEVKSYNSYEIYRNAVRTDNFKKKEMAANDKSATSDVRMKSSASQDISLAPRNINRAKERREIALRKDRIRAIEKEIEELEQLQKETEASFSKETRPEEYAAYAEIAEKLSAIYEEYITLSETDCQ